MSDRENPGFDREDEEVRAFRELGDRGASVPPALKPRVIGRLEGLSLLSTGKRRPATWFPWAAAAALAVLGFGVGRWGALPPRAGADSTRYVLLLTGAGSTTPQENARRRKEYGDWMAGLARHGMTAEGAELVGARHHFGTAGPPDEVVGYFVVAARDESQVLAIADTMPHVRHGGAVTVARLR